MSLWIFCLKGRSAPSLSRIWLVALISSSICTKAAGASLGTFRIATTHGESRPISFNPALASLHLFQSDCHFTPANLCSYATPNRARLAGGTECSVPLARKIEGLNSGCPLVLALLPPAPSLLPLLPNSLLPSSLFSPGKNRRVADLWGRHSWRRAGFLAGFRRATNTSRSKTGSPARKPAPPEPRC